MEDEAARYVLGEMTAAEQREFAARLERSAELRAVVRELEEGAVALATASPQREPPSMLWPQIEKAVARERRSTVGILGWWVGWVRSGWAAATVCAVGWVLYALLVKPPGPAINSPGSMAKAVEGQVSESPTKERHDTMPQPQPTSTVEFALFQARTQELGTLRRQIAELEGRLTQVSRTVTQQQALLSESNRLKFFQLTSGAGDGSDVTAPQALSPRLQWALYTAMARELGWRAPASTTGAANANGRTGEAHASETTSPSQSGVDFVDLRPTSNNVANAASASQAQTDLAAASQGSVSNNAVAGFISGTSAFLGFDSLVAPSGSLFTFWLMGPAGQYQAIGNATYWNNPTVVTVPASAGSGDGAFLTVTATTPLGAVTNIGHVFLPGVPAP